MKSLDEITKMAAHVSLHAALSELRRETKMRIGTKTAPGGAYNRWANAEPAKFTKHQEYERQAALLIAAEIVLATMTPIEFERRMKAATNIQPSLF